jgi:hypothetical protein
VPRQDCIDELGHHRLVIADNARKKFFAPLEFANQIRAHLVFDRDAAIAALFELAKSPCSFHVQDSNVSEPGAVATGSCQKPARQQGRCCSLTVGLLIRPDRQKELDRIYRIYMFDKMQRTNCSLYLVNPVNPVQFALLAALPYGRASDTA